MRPSVNIEYKGEIYSLYRLGKKFNIPPPTLHGRIFKRGLSVEQAIGEATDAEWVKGLEAKIDKGICEFNFVMRRFYSKHQRLQSYKQLRKDLEEIARMKMAA